MSLVDARRAALTLHALPAADREWVIRRLDPGQQQLVDEHLRELQALGVVADQRLVQQALAWAASHEPASSWRGTLIACDAASIQALLWSEPASLIARVLAQGPWPWEEALLAALGPTRSDQVRALRNSKRANSALDDWLMHELVRRLETVIVRHDPAPAERPPARHWLNRWGGGR